MMFEKKYGLTHEKYCLVYFTFDRKILKICKKYNGLFSKSKRICGLICTGAMLRKL